jgi:hypothetical protein
LHFIEVVEAGIIHLLAGDDSNALRRFAQGFARDGDGREGGFFGRSRGGIGILDGL